MSRWLKHDIRTPLPLSSSSYVCALLTYWYSLFPTLPLPFSHTYTTMPPPWQRYLKRCIRESPDHDSFPTKQLFVLGTSFIQRWSQHYQWLQELRSLYTILHIATTGLPQKNALTIRCSIMPNMRTHCLYEPVPLLLPNDPVFRHHAR